MAHEERAQLIRALEGVRGSRVLSYVLADRPSFPPDIAGTSLLLDGEAGPFVAEQMRAVGRQKKLDLFFYTRGGATDVVWPLVSLLREHCDRFAVLVPYRAHSGGTLVCLGADEIVLTSTAELSPIDPTTGNQFNPADPSNPQARYGISVEDVAAYFDLADKRAGLKGEQQLVEVFRILATTVHPLALGNVQRVYQQIRRLARRLLAMHLDETQHQDKIEAITKALTEEFFSHVHAITRKEAIELLGNWARVPNDEEAAAIEELFAAYRADLHLTEKFNLPVEMGNEQTKSFDFVNGYLETTDLSFAHVTDIRVLQRPVLPPNVQVQAAPGASVPLEPWPNRNYDIGIMRTGWVRSEGNQ